MTLIITSFILNSIAGLILALLYTLFFAKNVVWNKKKVKLIFGVILIVQLLGAITQNRALVWIVTFLPLLLINILCSTKKIYNFFMMLPAFFFYLMLEVLPQVMIEMTFNLPDVFLGAMSLHGIITDVSLCTLLIVSAILCMRKKISLLLTGKEVLFFCIYFFFLLFNCFVIWVFSTFLANWLFRIGGGLIILFFAIFVLGVYWSFLFTKRENKKLSYNEKEARNFLDMQLQYAEQNEESEQELRQLRHDLRGHMQVLGELCDQKDYERVDRYVEELSGNPGLSNRVHITGNATADIVLSLKRAEAIRDNMEFTCEGDFTPLEKMNAVDICTIFSNIMNNALEASQNVQKPKIQIEGIRHLNYFTLIASNRVDNPVKIKNNRIVTTKSDKRNHGIGLDSIKNVVKKYQGDCVLECKDGWFSIKLMMMIRL